VSVKVAVCTVQNLLSGKKIITNDGASILGQLTIPEYQRPYRWQFSNIKRVLDDYRESIAEKPELPFYMGSIILHKATTDEDLGRNNSPQEVLNIIDGQQRLTSLSMLALLKTKTLNEMDFVQQLHFSSPESQQQIKRNLADLSVSPTAMEAIKNLDFNRMVLTLVITNTEDKAYQFFETQNTGGVRLKGPDIIKAHHLRSVEARNRSEQLRRGDTEGALNLEQSHIATKAFAERWEALGELSPVVDLILKARFWKKVKPDDDTAYLPQQKQTQKIRSVIVKELAEKTTQGPDVAYGYIEREYPKSFMGNPFSSWKSGGEVQLRQAQMGYALRQPLNSGANTIHFIEYFETLRKTYLDNKPIARVAGFTVFYQKIIQTVPGCGYIKPLFDACLLMYISQFGEQRLHEAALKIFRVVYSRRIANQKSVKEKSIPAFVSESPVLDWINQSYTIEQCFSFFDAFKLDLESTGLTKVKDQWPNNVKSRFITTVVEELGLDLRQEDYVERFIPLLDAKIIRTASSKELV
tara:strand:+ start:5337 stop:6908 length:1572 start_codon:yes stop_codon:yes gene_type:complete